MTINWGQFHEITWPSITKISLKITYLKISFKSPWSQWVRNAIAAQWPISWNNWLRYNEALLCYFVFAKSKVCFQLKVFDVCIWTERLLFSYILFNNYAETDIHIQIETPDCKYHPTQVSFSENLLACTCSMLQFAHLFSTEYHVFFYYLASYRVWCSFSFLCSHVNNRFVSIHC